MASASTDHDIDLEAQQNLSQPCEDAGGSDTHDLNVLLCQSDTRCNDNRPFSLSTNRDPNPVPAISQDDGNGRSSTDQINVHQTEDDGAIGHLPTQAGPVESQAEVHTRAELLRSQVLDEPPIYFTLGNFSGRGPEEKRMIGDFDGSANALWNLYGKEAKSHDEAQIRPLKEDMDGVLIFAGLFSAALTAFIIDSKQNLKVSPTDQMIYYLKQNVAMLDQISHQIASISPQVSIPSTPPPAFPSFKPLSSDIRVNVFWFMALIFSLIAALLAILVQQWVRDYMHVFQRYSDPLKSARLRNYLHEGLEGWYMPVVTGAVPGLLHVALFLFFIGLCDVVLNVNTTVGLSTTIPIGIIGFLYILTIFVPVAYPQSPYRNSFSGVIWYLVQKLRSRRFKDRSLNEASKPVSSNMAEGQMQLAMEETEDRKGRDQRAIQWLASNMTEDTEMESFVMAIPGSFNGEWGEEVWVEVSNAVEKNTSTNRNQPSQIQGVVPLVRTRIPNSDFRADAVALLLTPHPPDSNFHSRYTTVHTQGEDTMRELSARVAHVLETCKNRRIFTSDEPWRRRTRACVETTASLVCCAGANLGQFGDIVKLLGDIAIDQKLRESSSEGKDQSFVIRWTCFSLVTIRRILESDWLMRGRLRVAWIVLKKADNDGTGGERGPTHFQKMVETFDKAWRCLHKLSCALILAKHLPEEPIKEILRRHEYQISELEHIFIEAGRFQDIDEWVGRLQQSLDEKTHGIITRHLPGVNPDDFGTEPIHFSQFVEFVRHSQKFQFIFPVRVLKRMSSVAHTLRNILDGPWDVDAFQEVHENLAGFLLLPNWRDNPFHRLAWRSQDLCDGGGLGFTVELFFLALKQLLSTSSSNESHPALYIGTFRAITSDWRKYKGSLATQKLLLDMLVPYRNSIYVVSYPAYIVDEFLVLLGNLLQGQTGPHIDDVVQRLTREIPYYTGSPCHSHFVNALVIITLAQESSS